MSQQLSLFTFSTPYLFIHGPCQKGKEHDNKYDGQYGLRHFTNFMFIYNLYKSECSNTFVTFVIFIFKSIFQNKVSKKLKINLSLNLFSNLSENDILKVSNIYTVR